MSGWVLKPVRHIDCWMTKKGYLYGIKYLAAINMGYSTIITIAVNVHPDEIMCGTNERQVEEVYHAA